MPSFNAIVEKLETLYYLYYPYERKSCEFKHTKINRENLFNETINKAYGCY